MSAPRTLYDKIFDDHVVDRQDDGTCLLYIDRHLVHEVTSPQAFEGLRMAGRKVRHPERTLAVVDHTVPTSPDRVNGIKNEESRIQVEAAKALGLTGFQRFRLVVWPQAFRTILPPYGNDFVAMVKDSSLVSVLGVADITQMAKIYSSGSFRYMETYAIVAYIYLILTIGLSMALRRVERKLRRREARER